MLKSLLVTRVTARTWRYPFLLAIMAGAAAADWYGAGVLPRLYALPVALAALLYGWRGGLLAGGISSLAIACLTAAGQTRQWTGDAGVLLALGWLVGHTAGRQHRLRQQLQAEVRQLSGVYERTQTNFEAMKRAERLSAIGQLSAGLAHEIRNPLAGIAGAASILQRKPGLEPKHAKCVEIIIKESQRLNNLLTDFLNFARPRPPRLQLVDLDSVLDNVLALADHSVRTKPVHFRKRVEAGLPPAQCDPEQLEQVLLNLLINAVEASPEGETVLLVAERAGSRIAVRVLDRGHGVAPAHVDRLFDPFFTTKDHGTGLGLPVAHQIMGQMGGALLAERNPGQGMVFTVLLPEGEPA